MAEYKKSNATIRVYGEVNKEILKAAAEKFVKEAYRCKQAKLKSAQ